MNAEHAPTTRINAIAEAASVAGFKVTNMHDVMTLVDAVRAVDQAMMYPDFYDGPAMIKDDDYPDYWRPPNRLRRIPHSRQNWGRSGALVPDPQTRKTSNHDSPQETYQFVNSPIWNAELVHSEPSRKRSTDETTTLSTPLTKKTRRENPPPQHS